MSDNISCLLNVKIKNNENKYVDTALNVTMFEGNEAVSSLYQFKVTVAFGTDEEKAYTWSDIQSALGKAAMLTLADDALKAIKVKDKDELAFPNGKMHWHGIITNIVASKKNEYIFTLEPAVAKLRWMVWSDIYLDKNLEGIIEEVFTNAAAPKDLAAAKVANGWDYEFNPKDFSRDTKQLFTCQFEESCWDFIQRRAEFFGVFYAFEHSEEKSKLVFHEDLIVNDETKFLPANYHADFHGDENNEEIAIRTLSKSVSLQPSQIVLQRRATLFNSSDEKLTPVVQKVGESAGIDGISQYSTRDQFAFAETAGTDPENINLTGETLAKLRAEAIESSNNSVKGIAKSFGMTAGAFVSVASDTGKDENFYVLSVKHSWYSDEYEDYCDNAGIDDGQLSGVDDELSLATRYQAAFVLHPCFESKEKTNDDASKPTVFDFRPEQKTPIPSIDRLVSGFIDGVPYKGKDKNTGAQDVIDTSYPTLDEYGRYKVRFDFARASKESYENNSAWLRMATPYAGGVLNTQFDKQGQSANDNAYKTAGGMHFPLRPGTEVLIAFVNGDPDDPVIVSALANKTSPAPVNKTNSNQFVLKTPVGNTMLINDSSQSDQNRSAWHFYTPATNTQLNLGAFYYEAGKDGERETYGSSGFMLSTDGKGIIHTKDQLTLKSDKSVEIISGDVGDTFDNVLKKVMPGYRNQEKFQSPLKGETPSSNENEAMTEEGVKKIIKAQKDKDDGEEYFFQDKPGENFFKSKKPKFTKPSYQPYKVDIGSYGAKVDLSIGVTSVKFEGYIFKFNCSVSLGIDIKLAAEWKISGTKTKETKLGKADNVAPEAQNNVINAKNITIDNKAYSLKSMAKCLNGKIDFTKSYLIKGPGGKSKLEFNVPIFLGFKESLLLQSEKTAIEGDAVGITGKDSVKITKGEAKIAMKDNKVGVYVGTKGIIVGSRGVTISGTGLTVESKQTNFSNALKIFN